MSCNPFKIDSLFVFGITWHGLSMLCSQEFFCRVNVGGASIHGGQGCTKQNRLFAVFSSLFGLKSCMVILNFLIMSSFVGLILGQVDLTPRFVLFVCPFAMAVESVRWFLTADSVRPGHFKKWSFLIALGGIALVGLKRH